MKTREFLIDKDPNDGAERVEVAVEAEQVARRRQLQHRKLQRIVAYATTGACLRAIGR